jgi:hypothetical protein
MGDAIGCWVPFLELEYYHLTICAAMLLVGRFTLPLLVYTFNLYPGHSHFAFFSIHPVNA